MRFLFLLATVVAFTANAQFGGTQGTAPAIPTSQDAAPLTAGAGLHPWLAVNGLYRRNLDGPSTGEASNQFYPSFAGGFSGWKNWRMRRLSGSYSGSGTHRSRNLAQVTWTQSHTVILAYEQQVSQRLSYNASQFGGITYGGYGYGSSFGTTGTPGLSSGFGPGTTTDPGAGGLSDFANNGIVDGELLDTRIKFLVSSGSVNYRVSQRMMLSGTGAAALTRRGNQQLSQNNLQAGGNIGYLLSERTQVGAEYTYSVFRYPQQFGGVDTQTAMLNARLQLSPTTVIYGGAGVGLMNSEFIGQVPIDPALAALLGSDTALAVTKANFLTPSYQFQIRKNLQRGSLFAGAARAFNGGNGVLLAGVRDSVTVGYTHVLNPRIGLTGVASYQRLSGRVGTIARTESAQGAAVLSIRLVGSFNFTTQAGMRYIRVTSGLRRREVLAGFGLVWMPGGNPFTF